MSPVAAALQAALAAPPRPGRPVATREEEAAVEVEVFGTKGRISAGGHLR